MKISVADCIIEFVEKRGDIPEIISLVNQLFQEFKIDNPEPGYRIHFSAEKTPIRNSPSEIYFKDKLTRHNLLLSVRNILKSGLEKNGFFLHCSAAIAPNNKALVFLGNSGAGKSTISELLNPQYKKIADDMAIVRKKNGKYILFQSPYPEKVKLKKEITGYPIDRIYFLHKSKTLRTVRQKNITKNISGVYQQVWFDWEFKASQFKTASDICKKIPFYKIEFPKDKNKLVDFFLKEVN